MSISHRPSFGWRVTVVWLLLGGPLLAGPVPAAGEVLFEVRDGRDFQGHVKRATYDRHGVAWIATHQQLFRVEGGRPRLVDSAGSSDRLLVIAPGGERYAWLENRWRSYGQFAVELMDLNRPGSMIAELKPSEFPYGFTTLHFGHVGKLAIGVTDVMDVEGRAGTYRYLFWSDKGKPQRSMTLEGHRTGTLDDRGESIVLLGKSDAKAFRMDGTELWSVSGRYGKAALARAGETALLNPTSQATEVHVVQSGRMTKKIRMPAPVQELAITPDGSLGAVATRAGRVSIVDLGTCATRDCSLRHLPQLPILSTHYITAIRFINRDSVVIGVIQAVGAGRMEKFYSGAVLVMKTSGALTFQRSIGLPESRSWSPSLDVTYGDPVFTAYTPSTAIFVRVED